jgi:tripartite-type tricarboxylate transporter receptor subunit TctC
MMIQNHRTRGLAVALAISSLVSHAACIAADASSYPTRPIRFIMPYPVGGTIDMSGRLVAQQVGTALGQQVVVDNRTGAGGTLGTETAAKSPPDGYTIVMGGTGTLAVSPSLDRKLGYDPVRDFAPITLLATTPYVLVIHPSVPAASTRELIALAKAQPGKLNYASGGSGSAPHLLGEMFRTRAGINVLHIPYKGSSPAKIDLVAGRVQMFFTGIPPVLGDIRAGTLRAVGVTSGKRTNTAAGRADDRRIGRRRFRREPVVRRARARTHARADREAPEPGDGERVAQPHLARTAGARRCRHGRQHAKGIRDVHSRRNGEVGEGGEGVGCKGRMSARSSKRYGSAHTGARDEQSACGVAPVCSVGGDAARERRADVSFASDPHHRLIPARRVD